MQVPVPPKIPTDGLFSALSITNDINSYGLYSNETIVGVPLSVDESGAIGITPCQAVVFPVGVTPAAVTTTYDSTGRLLAYVANNNNYGISGSDSVTVLDLDSGLPLTTITDSSFNEPYTVTVFGTLAYVTNSYIDTITIIRVDTQTVLGTISGFNGPSGLVVKPTGIGYVNNYGAGMNSGLGNTVSIVDLTIPAVVGTINLVSIAPAAVALSPDQKYLYVAMYNNGATNMGSLEVYDTTNGNMLAATVTGLSGPFAIAVNPNGLKVYVTNFGSNNFVPYGTTVSVIDTETFTVSKTITTGIQPAGIAISPNNKYLYVSNYNSLYNSFSIPVTGGGGGSVAISNLIPGDGTVSIIDLETETVVAPTVKVGQSPSGLTCTPDGKWLLCTNYGSNSVSGIYINQGLDLPNLGPI